MRTTNSVAHTLGALLLSSLAISQARAISITQTGTFTTDAQVVDISFTLPTAQTVDFFTTSYAGGMNLNGTTSSAGGFVPSLTLFSVSTGLVVDCGAAGTTCSGMAMGSIKLDPLTQIADDVNFTRSLAAGSYVLALTQYPNVAIGGINDGFLTSIDSTLFTDACGAGAAFRQADTSPCAQRNGNYSVNVGTVPEPATLWLSLPILAFSFIGRKRLLSRS
jgi:hypothetical protein